MSSLVARDLRQREIVRYRWSLVEAVDLPLGRTVQRDQLQTAWDQQIAAWHAVVRWERGRLRVTRRSEPASHNAIYYGGLDCDEFAIVPGEGFVIGTTIFQLDRPQDRQTESRPQSSSGTQFFNVEDLRTQQLCSENEHLQVLYALLRQFQDRQLDLNAFEVQVVQTLKRVVRRADFAAILNLRGADVAVHKGDGNLGVCEPLVLESLQKQMLVAHRWGTSAESKYPAVRGATWAVSAPILSGVETEGDYGIYLTGAKAPASGKDGVRTLPEDQLSFVAIVAGILQQAHTFSNLAECRKSMQEFFPKQIRDLLLSHDPSDVFRTEEVQAAILFCDLRGSSRFAEQQARDLVAAWNRMKEALGVMTEAITNQYGSIGDFQGDSAMGFWGWPRLLPGADSLADSVQSACQAADMLRERFHQRSRDQGPLAGFACGIGIAAGPVVAGMLGTVDQRKIGVFGPAVNLAARLETMTKQLGASILIDDRAQQALREAGGGLPGRLRYLADIQPVGLDTSVRVHELMPPAASESALSPKQLKLFEFGRAAFERGNWNDARVSLQQLAQAGDGPSRFLVSTMDRLQTPPANWRGCIVLTAK